MDRTNDMMSRLRERGSLPRIINDIDYEYVPESFLKEIRDRLPVNERPMKTCMYMEHIMNDETKALWDMQKHHEAVITRELMIPNERLPNPFASYTDYRLAQFKNDDGVNLCWFHEFKLVGPAMKIDKDDEEH